LNEELDILPLTKVFLNIQLVIFMHVLLSRNSQREGWFLPVTPSCELLQSDN
jgi:hypothetical protein